jgi:pimeloyl-ACP methyl ester carboxylesterase
MQPRAGGRFLWHMAFQSVPDVPELLIRGHERAYVKWFFDNHAYDPSAIDAADLDVYVAAIEQPGALRAGLGVYRAYFDTSAQVASLAASPLQIPVVACGGEASLGELALASARVVAPDAGGGVIPRCGHWAPDEAPEFVAGAIRELTARPSARARSV